MSEPVIRPLSATPEVLTDLGHLLVATVAGGGSVSFMHPLPIEDAIGFWRDSLAAAERGERIVFGACEEGKVVATVTLITRLPPNQPHRAEIAKMMTAPAHRGRGLARALLDAAEVEARALGKTHLLLDTASDEGASGLYEKAGFQFAGEIPEFALKPHGGLTGTRFYWKRL